MGPITVVTIGDSVVTVSEHIDVPLLPRCGSTGQVVLALLHPLENRYLDINKDRKKGKSNSFKIENRSSGAHGYPNTVRTTLNLKSYRKIRR